jgi:hypothetical protein
MHWRVIGLDMTENMIFTLCRMIIWVVFLRMFWNFISSLPVKRGESLSILVGTSKVKIVKNERDPPLFTGKLLIKFQNILRNTTQDIIRHREVVGGYTGFTMSVRLSVHPSVCRQFLCRTITWVVFLRIFKNFISCLLLKSGWSLSFLTIFTFDVPELLDLIWWKIEKHNSSYRTT